ncbi:hypothetical protein P43SY_009329 [Pythium insidiosum]|uniref:tRNA (guanine(9)-N(1))-methyltransferase n=1 Tax=Pythium insidiosum TaxID=114742 RepID=A0AAD5L9Q3_PYTIN|nr:hypothetical protein P43SY_009329 [Pythium insidiosum]
MVMMMMMTQRSHAVVVASVIGLATATALAIVWRRHRAGAGFARSQTKQQRRDALRDRRRQHRDELLARRKLERAAERTAQEQALTDEQKRERMERIKMQRVEQYEQALTDEQKRERMERIKMQRVEQYQKLDDGRVNGLRVVVDLAFAEQQTTRECHSVFKQLGCAYGYMKQCPLDRVISLRVASCAGAVRAIAEHHGLHKWKIHVHEEPVDAVYDPRELVYLSPDAEDVLLELDPRAVYVVGGIVDRSVRKGESLAKASRRRLRSKRLPLPEHLSVRKPVLNIDNVLVALNEVMNHGDWPRALATAVPKRMLHEKQVQRATDS